MASILRKALTVALFTLSVLPGCSAEVADDGDEDAIGSASDELSLAARRQRARAYFAAPVISRMYQVGNKVVGDRTVAEVAAALRSQRPSLVSGLIRVDSDPNLDSNGQAFTDFKQVRQSLRGVPFDVVLNACQYRTADALTSQMKRINDRLGSDRPEAWFFDFYDTPLRTRDEPCDARGPNARAILRKVAEWAHRNDQLIGGNVWQAQDLPEGADFTSIPDELGPKTTLEDVAKLPKNVVRLVHVENNPQKCWGSPNDPKSDLDDPRRPRKERCRGSSGEKYIWRTSPADRKKYDAGFVAAGRKNGFSYMRPVFFPLSYHLAGGEKSQAFDRNANAPPTALPYVAGPQ